MQVRLDSQSVWQFVWLLTQKVPKRQHQASEWSMVSSAQHCASARVKHSHPRWAGARSIGATRGYFQEPGRRQGPASMPVDP
mmetsp:Transcript_78945/g.130497  ORF Transcript_78945/g.130497 Transcript_78945/m.130497 type:complete len:82 (-) Transcript_78945:33-278(-)